MSVLTEILERHPGAGRNSLIPILQEIQEAEGYLSKESVLAVGRHLNLASAKIYGVATFYNQFRFQPVGLYHIQVCRGTACHVKGSAQLLESLERALGIKAGETSRDGMFSLEVVACIGACGLAPVISVNGEFHGKLNSERVDGVLGLYRQRDEVASDQEEAVK